MRHTILFALALSLGCSEPAELGEPDSGSTTPDAPTPSVDDVDFSCRLPAWAAGACAAGVITELLPLEATHVDLPELIEYADNPPTSGKHRPQWAKWGEYEFLPPQRWVHNLEHGGVAFLYHPCADPALVAELREFAQTRPEDSGGEFRWVMTPHVDLPTAVAVVAWNWKYEAECAEAADMDVFTANHYRRAPEDVAGDGDYSERWIGP